MITKIRKRDGREAPFNIEKITNAIYKAFTATGGVDYDTAMSLSIKVAEQAEKELQYTGPGSGRDTGYIVEKVLIGNGYDKTAKAYILYRAERNRVRGDEHPPHEGL